ncbi:hypothetical protein [Streptomyces sp. B6B3]|uniref:hypothetical protein n=1 Tax=Streptomyces sp. B6B3 TaxID=3153570 RepID=UPI00325E2086
MFYSIDLAAQQTSSSALPATAVVASCALFFTIASFWWLNARQGRLRTWEPKSFAVELTASAMRLRLPLVLHNTGAKPIIVQDFRLSFTDTPDSIFDLPWVSTRKGLRPEKGEELTLPAGFALGGRAAEQVFIEFRTPFPEFHWTARDYNVTLRVKMGHRKDWRVLANFPLRFGHILYPDQYMPYSNSPRKLTEDETSKANEALARLAESFETSIDPGGDTPT